MQVTETSTEGLKREFRVVVPASDLSERVTDRLTQMKDQVKINGFRPGKVPVAHLKRVYGRSVMAETIDQTIRDTNSQLFTDRGFRLATEPKVTMPTSARPMRFMRWSSRVRAATMPIATSAPAAINASRICPAA